MTIIELCHMVVIFFTVSQVIWNIWQYN